MKYRVYMKNTVSTSVVVEASDPDEAIDEALREGLPGLIFLNHQYPDEGDWEPCEDAVEEVEV